MVAGGHEDLPTEVSLRQNDAGFVLMVSHAPQVLDPPFPESVCGEASNPEELTRLEGEGLGGDGVVVHPAH